MYLLMFNFILNLINHSIPVQFGNIDDFPHSHKSFEEKTRKMQGLYNLITD